jgi:hypothetical protein
LEKFDWCPRAKKPSLTTGTSPKTFTFGQGFGQQANLIFHLVMQRACQPPKFCKNPFISRKPPDARAAF